MVKMNRRATLVSLALVILTFLALGAGCTTQTAGSASPTPTSGPIVSTLDFVDAIASGSPSVVIVTADITIQGAPGTSTGTGWVVDASGIIVTNNHVVEGGQSITVTLHDGRSFNAQAVRTNPGRDLAVIKIGAQGLPPLTIGDSSTLQVGQRVAALGDAVGLGISMTGGYVSRLNTSITLSNNVTLDGIIQTDAVVNHGDSGGPLITMDGKIIGIVTAGLEGSAQLDIEGIYYAISINMAMPVINNLISQLPK